MLNMLCLYLSFLNILRLLHHSLSGRKFLIQKINSKTRQSVKTLMEQSFQVHGPQLFNCMPAFIRKKSMSSVQEFKEALIQYITKVQTIQWLPGLSHPHVICSTRCHPIHWWTKSESFKQEGPGTV